MKEELYIYTKDGERKSVDLNTPSGITLKWVSNLFNSLDKVNCSYSYTFKIPMTRHNREVFDMAEDIRHDSGMLGRKVRAEFIQNGIPLFYNANLYISKSTADSYSCVFTWGVLEGLQKLKDDGCSINELRTALIKNGETDDELIKGDGYIYWDGGDDPYDDYTNEKKFFNAAYSAGISRVDYDDTNPTLSVQQNVSEDDGVFYSSMLADLTPKAVMPVRYIIEKINKAFDTKFDICKKITGSDLKQEQAYKWLFKDSNVLDYGVLPLTGNKLTDNQEEIYSRPLKILSILGSNDGLGPIFSSGTIMGTEYLLTFDISDVPDDKTYNGDASMPIAYIYAKRYDDNGNKINWNLPSTWEELTDNYLGWKYPKDMIVVTSTYDPKKHVCIGVSSEYAVKLTGSFRITTSQRLIVGKEDDTMVKLNVYSIKEGDMQSDGSIPIERVDITSIKPVSVTTVDGTTYTYEFNMNDDEGFNSQSLENTEDGGRNFFWFGFSHSILSFVQYTDFKIVAQINDEKKQSHLIDTYTNLPDIDCLAFMKTLFYIQGSYPCVKRDGTITANKYIDIRDNLKNGFVYDWSRKIMAGNEEEITYNASDFKQNNYYMTKWDDLERTEEDLKEEEDVYEDGVGDIICKDETLDTEQTVQQIPFYSPYILNRKHPKLGTGNTIKIWDVDNSDQEITWSGKYLRRKELQTITEAHPAYGYVHRIPYMEKNNSKIIPWSKESVLWTDKAKMRMSVLNPFKDILMNPSYRYLQQIVEKPYVITESFLLNELDLMDIDYTRPVYIEKYNSYFAIISIQRDSKGVCKCELIKLPTYKAPVKVTLSFTSQLAKFLHFKCSSTSREDKTITIGFIIENPNEGQYVMHSVIPLSGGEFQLFNPTSNLNWTITDVWLDHYEKGDYNDYEFEIQ